MPNAISTKRPHTTALNEASLARSFLPEVEAAVSQIANAPYQFEEFRTGMRRFILRRFPYSMCYRILNSDLIEIIVVKHHSRRPSFGMRRK